MSTKKGVLFFVITFVLVTNLHNAEPNTEDNAFSIISTSPSPPLIENMDFRLNKVEKILEEKLTQIEKTIKNLEEKLHDMSSTRNCQTIEPTHSQETLPKNCEEVQQRGTNISGIYVIQPESSADAFIAVCDMETKGGGWTLFLNRFDGSQDFYLNWDSYKNGFGNLGGEFWLGLEHLHQLIGKEVCELLIELKDWDSKTVYAHYSFFSIGSEEEGYALKLLANYSGDAGDSFTYQAGNKFSTKDKDQDADSGNCATYHTGAWWYKACMYSHLTGKYLKASSVPESSKFKIMYWEGFRGSLYSLKEARMMVRPRDNKSSSLQ